MDDEPRQCGHRTKQGGICKRPLAEGEVVCYWHGGAAPQVRRKAAERRAQAQALRILQAMEPGEWHGEPITDPIRTLQQVLGDLDALYQAAKAQLPTPDQWVEDGKFGPQIDGYLLVIAKLAKQITDGVRDMQRLGLDERLVARDERVAALICQVIEATLADLDLTAEHRAAANAGVVRHLRALTA